MGMDEESAKNKKFLPWVEKYRPSTLDDLVSHEDIIRTISKFIRDNQVPHLLFYGPPGTGKTSTILACARQLYTPSQFGSMVLELNASDDRGIGIVRGQVLTFASTRTIFKSGFKLIILDEADAMTMDAQNALRRSEYTHFGGYGILMSDVEEEDREQSFTKQLKIAFIGEAGVGKTSLIRRFCYDEFTRQYNQTIGADFYIRRLLLPGRQEVSVRVTDIGGSELRGHMLSNYLFSSNMIILVYDITNSLSFDALPTWIETCRRIIENAPVCAVIGNKCDLEHQRTVRLDKTQHFVREYKLTNFLASAKTGESVNASLMELIAKHFKVPLSRVEKEHQETVVRAELVPPTTAEPARPNPSAASSNSSVCCVQ